jgi:purine-nucleoside phosphorylase
MANCPTPHIAAEKDQIAKTVLMPGDPLRAKFIAENFLENAVLVNNIRGIQGYTGTYKGSKVTVMASGMGIPSMGIYSYELYNFYDVDNIIRIGSAGSIHPDVNLRDIVFGMGASTNSNFASQYCVPGTLSAICDYRLLTTAVGEAKEMGVNCRVGNILSADNFYEDNPIANDAWSKMGIMAIEMEAAGLYLTAARAGKNALAMCTISDHILRGERLSVEERQTGFSKMIEIALSTATKL